MATIKRIPQAIQHKVCSVFYTHTERSSFIVKTNYLNALNCRSDNILLQGLILTIYNPVYASH